jgi:CMP-N,N'-diacetyllegionaminic acid synthase
MIEGKTFLAIIPARGGSKRLPRKNMLDLAGKPLIAWTIEAARKSKYLDEVMVTTDDIEIADVAKKYGATTPFIRPESLASDTTTTYDTVEHAINYYKQKLYKTFDYIVLLQPTSPLRDERHIDEAIETLRQKDADAVISVCEVEHSPLWSNILPDDGDMSGFLKDEVKNRRSQDLPAYYRLNGAIYICRSDRLVDEKSFFLSTNLYAYMMSKQDSIDIDNKIDFDFADFLLSRPHT